MSRTTLSIAMTALLVPSVVAKTWYVGSFGADFTEIQPAIDAASPGDVVLVNPDKDYLGFVLGKGLTIRSRSARFRLRQDEDAVIANVAAGQSAQLSGMEWGGNYVHLFLTSCDGEVGVDDVSLGGVSLYQSLVTIDRCKLAPLTGIQAKAGPCGVSAIAITGSTVQLSSIIANGGPACFAAENGPAAMTVESSEVVLALPSLVGGKGGTSNDGCIWSCPHG